MYYRFFGLEQAPFKVTPDCRLFYAGGNRGAILEALVFAICNGEGILKVVGEVGSGKTMLCRMLEACLPKNVDSIYLANPSLSPDNILHAIALELGLVVGELPERLRVMHALQQHLLRMHAQGRRVVMFVEEAQSMPLATMEEIRLLSNLETQQDKLLQIVLFGQPELDQLLALKSMRQLRERIAFSFKLMPLGPEDIRAYINSRLSACGYGSHDLFTADAVRLLTRYSLGLMRRINILADKSLLAAYAAGVSSGVGRREVRRAVADSDYRRSWRGWLPSTSVIMTIAFGFTITLLGAAAQHALARLAQVEAPVQRTSIPLTGKVQRSRDANPGGSAIRIEAAQTR